MNAVMTNPDCRDEKHRSCSGDGWDMDADETVDCPCWCHEPPAKPTYPVGDLSKQRRKRKL